MQLLGAWLDMFHAGVPALAGDRDDAQAGGQEHGGGAMCPEHYKLHTYSLRLKKALLGAVLDSHGPLLPVLKYSYNYNCLQHNVGVCFVLFCLAIGFIS